MQASYVCTLAAGAVSIDPNSNSMCSDDTRRRACNCVIRSSSIYVPAATPSPGMCFGLCTKDVAVRGTASIHRLFVASETEEELDQTLCFSKALLKVQTKGSIYSASLFINRSTVHSSWVLQLVFVFVSRLKLFPSWFKCGMDRLPAIPTILITPRLARKGSDTFLMLFRHETAAKTLFCGKSSVKGVTQCDKTHVARGDELHKIKCAA